MAGGSHSRAMTSILSAGRTHTPQSRVSLDRSLSHCLHRAGEVYSGALDEAVHCGPARAAARNAIDAIVQSTSQRCARVACSIQVHGVYATIAVRMNSCCFLLKLVYMPNIANFPDTIDSLFSYFNIRVIAGVYCDLICSRSHIIFFRAVTLCVLHVQ